MPQAGKANEIPRGGEDPCGDCRAVFAATRLRPVHRRPYLFPVALWLMFAAVLASCGRPPVIQARAALEPAPTPTPMPTPEEIPVVELEPAIAVPNSDPGVTSEVIRLVMVSDDRSEDGASDMFVSARRGIEAWARSVNSRGGLADREVKVVILKSAVSNAAEIIQEICDGDYFAMVGSISYYDDAGVEVMNSADCGIPDFPAAAMTPLRKASSVTYLSDPYLNAQYGVAALRERILSNPAAAQLSSNVQFEAKPFEAESIRMREAAESVGFGFREFLVSIGSGSDMTVQAEQLAASAAQSLVWTGAPADLATLLRALDDVEPEALDFVVCMFGCYDSTFTEALGAVTTPVYTAIPHLPFDEQDLSSQIREYLVWIGQAEAVIVGSPTETGGDGTAQEGASGDDTATNDVVENEADQGDGDGVDNGDDEVPEGEEADQSSGNETPSEESPEIAGAELPELASSEGFAAWVAGRLFEQAVADAVRFGSDDYDPALLTRENVLDAVRQIESWDARGAYGEASPASRIPSSCMVTMALTDGEWNRALPTERGAWDCSPENIAILRATADYGLSNAAQASSTNSQSVDSDPSGDSLSPDEINASTPAITDPLEASEEPADG